MTTQDRSFKLPKSIGLNRAIDVERSVDRDGYYMLHLGTFGCESVNGYVLPRLREQQILAYKDRESFSSVLTYGDDPSCMSISLSKVAGRIRYLFDEDTEEGQKIFARVKPTGPQNQILSHLLIQPDGVVPIGARYVRNNQGGIHLISWQLLDPMPYQAPLSKGAIH